MDDIRKPKEKLMNELAETRRRIAELETLETEHKRENKNGTEKAKGTA